MDLILTNGNTYSVEDTSSPGCIIIICSKKDSHQIESEITEQTIKNAMLGDLSLHDYKFDSLSIGETADGKAFITISLNMKSEIDILKERIVEQDAAIVELARLIVKKEG